MSITTEISPCSTCGYPKLLHVPVSDISHGYCVPFYTGVCSCVKGQDVPGVITPCNEQNPPQQKKEPMSDPIDHPTHYTSLGATCSCGRTIECIDVTENMGFCIGNAVKYLWRCGHKGTPLDDLRKARWYIEREIAAIEKEAKP